MGQFIIDFQKLPRQGGNTMGQIRTSTRLQNRAMRTARAKGLSPDKKPVVCQPNGLFKPIRIKGRVPCV